MAKSTRTKWVGAGACIGLAALAWFFPPGFYRDSQEPAIQEALARRLLERRTVDTAKFTVEGKAPSASLLKRLADLHVKLRASLDTESGPDGLLLDADTHKPTLTCELEVIRWISPVYVEIEAQVTEGLMGSSRATYVLHRSLAGWTVEAMATAVVS